MTKYGAKDFKWNDKDELFFKDKMVFRLERDQTNPDMYWILWPDSVKSAGFYNYTRARENALTTAVSNANKGSGEAL